MYRNHFLDALSFSFLLEAQIDIIQTVSVLGNLVARAATAKYNLFNL